jgi:hypothetical protein
MADFQEGLSSYMLTLNNFLICRLTHTHTHMLYHTTNLQKLCFNIYSTNLSTEYFKHAA